MCHSFYPDEKIIPVYPSLILVRAITQGPPIVFETRELKRATGVTNNSLWLNQLAASDTVASETVASETVTLETVSSETVESETVASETVASKTVTLYHVISLN